MTAVQRWRELIAAAPPHRRPEIRERALRYFARALDGASDDYDERAMFAEDAADLVRAYGKKPSR